MTRLGTLLPAVVVALLPEAVSSRRANWVEVARKDVADAGRSWQLYVLTGTFAAVLLVAPSVPLLAPAEPAGESTLARGLEPVVRVVRWLVPLAALLVGARSVVDEREAGSLRTLLGLPVTRREVVAGKLLGSSVVFATALLVGLVLAGAEVWYLYADFDVGTYATFVALTLLLGVVLLAVGVGISAATTSHVRATAASIGLFALLAFVWPLLSTSAFALVHGRFPAEEEHVSWYFLLANANPTVGYENLVEAWVDAGWSGARTGPTAYDTQFVGTTEPFYLGPEFVLFVLVLWGAVPVLLGSWQFSRSDF